MKKAVFIGLLILLYPILINSQVLDLTNVKREVIPIRYDSTFCFISSGLEQEDHAGFVGEEIEILDRPIFHSDNFSKVHIGKTLTITGFLPGELSFEDAFEIIYNSKEYILNLDDLSSSNAYFTGGLEKMKETLIGDSLTLRDRYSDEGYIQGFDGKRYNQSESFQVKDVKIAKIEDYEYSPVAIFEKELILKISESKYGVNPFVNLDKKLYNNFLGGDGDESMGQGGSSLGDYDDSGDGIFGRRVIYRNLKGLFSSKLATGKTVMKICINRAGIVSYVEILESTETNRKYLKQIIEAAKGYKYEPESSAPREQCGILTIDLDIQALRGG